MILLKEDEAKLFNETKDLWHKCKVQHHIYTINPYKIDGPGVILAVSLDTLRLALHT